MRRFIFTFRRSDGLSAELHLDLCPAFYTVVGWAWHGDPQMREIIAPLPNKQAASLVWTADARETAMQKGISFEQRYEGEPRPTAVRDYYPADYKGELPVWMKAQDRR